ncbi:MAG: 6-phosphogluconate dehydrogenase [Daejeonella sp.]|nr:6-phosphogluconate dehydrogenase [Daejeonella sp.]
MNIGWIGLGNMGTPIVINLLKAGYKVTVYNRSSGKDSEVVNAGASVAKNPQDLADSCEVIMIMVSDDHAVKQLFNEDYGLLSANLNGKLIIDLSTVSPDTSRELAVISQKHGAGFLDAPVSGSVKPAQDGTLIIMAGGEEVNFNKVKSIFEAIGKMALYLGGPGAGSSAKLAINYFLGITLQGFAETVLFANQLGVKQNDMLTIINGGALSSDITKGKSKNLISGDYTAAFPLKHLAKDLRLANDQGMNYPLFAPLSDSYQKALAAGYGELDVMSIFGYLSENSHA